MRRPLILSLFAAPCLLFSAQDLYVGTDHGIKKIAPDGSVSDFVAFNTSVMACGSFGEIYAANGNEIYRIDPDGGIAHVGTEGSGSNYAVDGLTVGNDGYLYMANFIGNSIGRMDLATGDISQFFTDDRFCSNPYGVATDPDGNVYFSNVYFGGDTLGTVIKVTPGGQGSVFATGTGYGLGLTRNAVDQHFYMTNNAGKVWSLDQNGAATLYTSFSGSDFPNAIVSDSSGNVAVARSTGYPTARVTSIAGESGYAIDVQFSAFGNPSLGLAYNPVPEPTTLAILGLGMLFVKRIRRSN